MDDSQFLLDENFNEQVIGVNEVIDEQEEIVEPIKNYNISTYGIDYDIEGLIKRLDRQDIIIPDFQRTYIWDITKASKFIESLLLGLPIPNIFLMRNSENQLMVIDGQQRLKTLQFFHKGIFPQNGKDKEFKLVKVQERFEGKKYDELDRPDQRKFNDSTIHAVIIKQDLPTDGDTSMYYIFDRLNTTAVRLSAQEIRSAIDHGPFIDLIKELNEYESWRNIYGEKNKRLKDHEMILRFLAFYSSYEGSYDEYKASTKNFLNNFSQKVARKPSTDELNKYRGVFHRTMDVIWQSLGDEAFRRNNTKRINAAVLDSVSVAIAQRLSKGSLQDESYGNIREAYHQLLADKDYKVAIDSRTSSENSVQTRMQKAINAFASV